MNNLENSEVYQYLKEKIQERRKKLPISRGLKKELVFVSALTSALLFLGKRKKTAALLGLGSALVYSLPNKEISFLGKSVVITGGSRGLGLALARQLIKEGAHVTILARDEEELKRAEQNLNELNSVSPDGFWGAVLALKCDVTNESELLGSLIQVESHFGKLDILINNAGSICAGPFETMTIADFESQLNLHTLSIIRATKLVIPFLKRSGGGNIVNISSLGGKIPIPHMTPYSTSKFALAGFSESVAAELSPMGIKVTAVYPGLMRTGSPIQAVFKGNYEKEFELFSLMDMTPGVSVSAQYAAETIVNAVRHGDSQVVISRAAKVGNFVHNNFPEIFNFSMGIAAKFLPKGSSTVRKTGAQIRHWIEDSLWVTIFKSASKHIEQQMNQEEKFDAEFNLNLEKESEKSDE